MKNSFTNSLQSLLDLVRSNFEKDGYLVPVLILNKGEEQQVVALQFPDQESKNKVSDFISDLISKSELKEYVMITESWITLDLSVEEFLKVKREYGTIEKYPNRKECIIVSCETPKESIVCMAVISRDSAVVLGDWEINRKEQISQFDKVGTLFQGLFASSSRANN